MRILVTGGLGYIGGFICGYLSRDYHVITTDCRKPDSHHRTINFELLDITDKKQTREQLIRLKPDIVIHLAGVKDLNFCQKNMNIVYDINVKGTANLVEALKNIKTRMIFLSTDYVFDGEKGMYKEDDQVNPQTYYGVTKVEGERFIMENAGDYAIIRTGGVYGSYDSIMSPLFLWLIGALKSGKTIEAYMDVYNTPTSLEILGKAMVKIISGQKTGLFHVAGKDRVNRFDFFKNIAVDSGFGPDLIKPVNNKGSDQAFLRPKDISLDTSKSHRLFNIP